MKGVITLISFRPSELATWNSTFLLHDTYQSKRVEDLYLDWVASMLFLRSMSVNEPFHLFLSNGQLLVFFFPARHKTYPFLFSTGCGSAFSAFCIFQCWLLCAILLVTIGRNCK
jgi:hypothetical protein